MDFKLVQQIVGNIQQTIGNSAVASVNALKANIFGVVVKNFPKTQQVKGSVVVTNQKNLEKEIKAVYKVQNSMLEWVKKQRFPTAFDVNNFPDFPKFPEFPKELKISNFPKQKEYPKEIKISNLTELKSENLVIEMGKIVKAIKAQKLDPKINVQAPKPEKIVVPPAHVSVTQQEIDYDRIAKALSAILPPDFDYKRFKALLDDSISNISVSGGGGGSAFKSADGRGSTGLVDENRHVQVDIAADSVGIGGGIQYAEGDTDDSITGTVAMVEGAANAVNPMTQPLTDTQLRASDVKITLDGESVPVTGTVTANLSAVDNAVLDQIELNQDTQTTHLDAIKTAVEGTLTVGSHAVTNAGTFAVQEDGELLDELRIFNGAYAMRVDDAGSGVTYQGWAVPGTSTSAASWRIRRITVSGTPEDTVIEFADGNNSFDNIYDNRASLSYS